jgi:Domain of unknown function (DUF4382)
MRTASHLVNLLAAGALLGATAACSSDLATRPTAAGGGSNGGTVATAPVALRLNASSTSSAGTTATGSLSGSFDMGGFGDFGDGMGHHWRGWPGRVRPSMVDSLIVTVSKVEVLVATPDSENAADSAADSARVDSMAHHGDDDGDDWEQTEWGWTSLDIVGSGVLDLVHLPDSTTAGLTVASGTLPPGTYRHVRLFVTTPMIYFDSTFVTPAGDTLKGGVGYPVVIPSADSTGAAIRTDESFTVPTGGGNVSLYFDRDDTVRHIVITGNGTIIVPPVMH